LSVKTNKTKLWLSALMAIMLLVTGVLPYGVTPVQAAGSSDLVVDGFTFDSNGDGAEEGSSLSNPKVVYESKLTISGSYGGTIVGTNLRIKMENGPDLTGTRPTIDSANKRFTFTAVPLKTGYNKIIIYSDSGTGTQDLRDLYVQYNNTPVFSDVRANGISMSLDNTFVSVRNTNDREISITGKAVNASRVYIKNNRTGIETDGGVDSQGNFSVQVDTELGENSLTLRAVNSSTDIKLDNKKVVISVSSSTQGEADLFYNAEVSYDHDNDAATTAVSKQLSNTKGVISLSTPTQITSFKLEKAKFLFNLPSDRQLVGNFELEILTPDNTSVTGSPIAIVATPSITTSGLYDITTAPTNLTGLTAETDYKIRIKYKWKNKPNAADPNPPENTAYVANYVYVFSTIAENKPVFQKVEYYKGTNKVSDIVLGSAINVVRDNNAEFRFDIVANPSPDPNERKILKNGALLSTGFTWTGNTLTFTSPPSGDNTYTVFYDDDFDGTNNEATDTNNTPDPGEPSVTFVLRYSIAPYIQLVDTKGAGSADDFIIESRYDVTTVPINLVATVFNFSPTAANTTIKINNNVLTNAASTSFSSQKISFSLVANDLQNGNNVLTINLGGNPDSTFTYNLFYSNAKVPTIKITTLEHWQNNQLEKLTSKPYQTNANFLGKFEFEVENAEVDGTKIEVEKNGKKISSFEYKLSSWTDSKSSADFTSGDTKDIFEGTNFSRTMSGNTAKLKAEMKSKGIDSYEELLEELDADNGELRKNPEKIGYFPLTLTKNETTTYTITVTQGSLVTRETVQIVQTTHAWEVLEPAREAGAKYAIVNSNTARVKIFAENADKILFGKTEAAVSNRNEPDFEYDSAKGKSIPKTYYVFVVDVPLKAGLNKIKYSVVVGQNTYNDEIEIYYANSNVTGASFQDVFGKKLKFSMFDKALELTFEKGTTLVSPSDGQAGQEVKNPSKNIFTEVPLFFGIADRTTGQVTTTGSVPSSIVERLRISGNFNYASPLYYIDAGYAEADAEPEDRVPSGFDPFFEGKTTIDGREVDVEEFFDRYPDNLVPSKHGTITLMYDKSIVTAANNTLGVFYNNGEGWKNIGGVVNPSKKSITVPFKGFGYYMVMKLRESYSDILQPEFEYARDAIETLLSKGIMNKDPDASGFGAASPISRGEFATMVVKALDLPINAGPYRDSKGKEPTEPTFSDVDPRRSVNWDYEYKYIETAARAGIIRGENVGIFGPNNPLTREQAAVIIARALQLKTGTLDASKLALEKMFTDGKDIKLTAAPSVLAVVKAKLMLGEPNDPAAKKPTFRFNPDASLNRAEMAVITIRLMQQLKKLPKQ